MTRRFGYSFTLSKTKLFGNVTVGKQAVYTALRVLQQLGLVEGGKGFPNTVLTELTERGGRWPRGSGRSRGS